MRPQCQMKEKINDLNFDEGLKRQSCQLMLKSSDYEENENKIGVLEDELFTSTTEASSSNSNEEQTWAVRLLKIKVKELLCLALANPKAFKIVGTDASDKDYRGVMKQRTQYGKESLVRFTSGV